MHLFGLKSIKALGVAKFGGLRFLRIRRQEANPRTSDIHYLRHAGAMSAAIAKNMTSLMSQSSDLTQSSTKSESANFLEVHSHYSFIAVVALMSLFLVVTLSATGLLLAFCRKKNTVFTAPTKSEDDSQFELDDIENSDVEIRRGDKGECYIHLSDDFDEDDDENEEDGKRKNSEDNDNEDDESDNHWGKRLRKFQRIRDILKHCRSFATSNKTVECGKQQKASKVVAPLLSFKTNTQKENQICRVIVDNKQNNAEKTTEVQGTQVKHGQQDWIAGYSKVVCHNPNHKHHYTHFNFLHRHHQRPGKPSRVGRTHIVYPSTQRHCFSSSGRLQRSHTIHAIPITSKRNQHKSVSNNHGDNINIKVEDIDNLTVVNYLKVTPEDATGIQKNLAETSEMEILNDDDDDRVCSKKNSIFDNLQLRLEDDSDKETYTYQTKHDLKQVSIDFHPSSKDDSVNRAHNDPDFNAISSECKIAQNLESSTFSKSDIPYSSCERNHDTELNTRDSSSRAFGIPSPTETGDNTFAGVPSPASQPDISAPNLRNNSNTGELFQSQAPFSHEPQSTELPLSCDTDSRESLPITKNAPILLDRQNDARKSFHANLTPSGSNSRNDQVRKDDSKFSDDRSEGVENSSPHTVIYKSNVLKNGREYGQFPLVKFSDPDKYPVILLNITETHEMANSSTDTQKGSSSPKEDSTENSLFNAGSRHCEILHVGHRHRVENKHDFYNQGDEENYYLTKSDYDGDDDEDDQTTALLN